MPTKTIYLLDPYNDVIKVIANQDSVFRLDLNKSIIYTNQQIWDAIDSMPNIIDVDNKFLKINRFSTLHQNNVTDLRTMVKNKTNLLQWNNSYCDNICGGIAYIIWAIYHHYIGNEQQTIGGGDENGMHVWNSFYPGYDGVSDNINKIPFFKGRYEAANFTDLQSDPFLYYEPIRRTWSNWHYSKVNYASYVTNSDLGNVEESNISTIDNAYMRMPSGSSFVFPVKSTNVPKREDGSVINKYANLIMTIPSGVTGNVEMPFNLLQITGTGVVVVEGVTYTLPDDEAVLKKDLQDTLNYTTEKWYHSFIINSSESLEAEFLVNYCRVLLFKKNIVNYTLYSGSITFERAKTILPVPTHILAINCRNNGSWTLDFCQYFTKNKSFKAPLQVSGWGVRGIYFLPNSDSKFSPSQWFQNVNQDTITDIDSGNAVTDQCWAAKLMPRTETFTTSLELSFTAIDDSDTYYTLDGTTPDATKTKYTTPFTISATTTVMWINIKDGYADSHVNTRVITKS